MKRRTFASISATGVAASLAGCIPDAKRVQELPRPYQGPEDADIVVQAFEDFACPHCAQFEDIVKPKLTKEYIDPGVIRFEHFDFPIPVHPRWSYEVANAARGVQDMLGNEAFFEYRAIMFENQDSYSRDFLVSSAEKVGVTDTDTFRNNLSASLYRPVIRSDKKEGNSRGVNGTPAVFVNGELVAQPDYSTISEAIEEARKQ